MNYFQKICGKIASISTIETRMLGVTVVHSRVYDLFHYAITLVWSAIIAWVFWFVGVPIWIIVLAVHGITARWLLKARPWELFEQDNPDLRNFYKNNE